MLVQFMITSGAEFPVNQLKAIFAAGTSIKVCNYLYPTGMAGMHQCCFGLFRESQCMHALLTYFAEAACSELPCTYGVLLTRNASQVIQTLSAGVNMVTQYMQPHTVLCNASGSHDVAVSEW